MSDGVAFFGSDIDADVGSDIDADVIIWAAPTGAVVPAGPPCGAK